MASVPLICTAGLAVGVLYGLFGVGSAFATPLLALLGVPGMAAVAGPLPALLPGSMTGAWSYSRDGKVDWWVAKRTVAGAFPAAIVGAIASQWVSGPVLVAISGAVLLLIGLRVLRPVDPDATRPVWAHDHAGLLGASAIVIGFSSGLLANGGGFLLVPLFLLAVGLDILGLPQEANERAHALKLRAADDLAAGRSSAELSPEEKDSLSHRGKALAALVPDLRALATGQPA